MPGESAIAGLREPAATRQGEEALEIDRTFRLLRLTQDAEAAFDDLPAVAKMGSEVRAVGIQRPGPARRPHPRPPGTRGLLETATRQAPGPEGHF